MGAETLLTNSRELAHAPVLEEQFVRKYLTNVEKLTWNGNAYDRALLVLALQRYMWEESGDYPAYKELVEEFLNANIPKDLWRELVRMPTDSMLALLKSKNVQIGNNSAYRSAKKLWNI